KPVLMFLLKNVTHRNVSSSATTPTNYSFDPCKNYRVINDYWRNTRSTDTNSRGHDDTVVEWKGWYRLYIEGKSAQLAETLWCKSYTTCGGYTTLWLGGSHPRLEDGIITQEIYKSDNYYWWYYNQCSFTRSSSVQVKACPGDYYVYKLVRPDVSAPMPTYCAVGFNSLTDDPCHNYVSLDQPWRANNESGLNICDSDFKWNGWYRLFYYGMNIHMPESCVDVNRCGTYYGLWLNGTHPRIEDGVVTRQVCANAGYDCCYFRSTPIRVKACPGNYYVYEFVSPIICNMAYCTGTFLIEIWSYVSVSITATPTSNGFDPCNKYIVIDEDWRNALTTSKGGHDDTLVEWSGWYRLYLQGKSAQISEWCTSFTTCGGYTQFWLNGSHPQLEDGIVTREIYGTNNYYNNYYYYYYYYYYNNQCSYTHRSKPIQVKACPGHYYVYKLVRPELSIPMPSYCTVAFDNVADPCYNYVSLDQPWRANNETGFWLFNRDFNWNGWYRLFYKGMNIRLSESCIPTYRCGAYITLWLNGPHPEIEDGVVIREACGNAGSGCCSLRLNPIRVKACPGNYYVYDLVNPPYSTGYCTEIKAQTVSTKQNITVSITVALTHPSYDPCYNYNVLDDPRRAINQTRNSWWCDTDMNWNGWYRLLYQGSNIRMPESCVSQGMCGTDVPLWLNGSHPRLEDGVVTRKICGNWNNDCCYFKSYPIQVKACPGNYYVYEFLSPSICSSAYCAAQNITTETPDLMMDRCREHTCTEHERCGERDGIYGCFCNESHSQTGDESYDSRETCESSSGTMSLSRCQLFEAGFPANILHLSDPSCNGTLQNGRLVFHFDNDDHICGTNLTANGTHFVYENSIQGVADSAGGPINRKKQLELHFSCIYQLSQTLTMDMEFNPLQSIVHKTLPDGQGMYQVSMIPFQDAAFSHPYNGSEDIVVDQRIYVEVIVKGVDSRQISTVIDACWVTPVNDQNFAVRWDLIINKCPNPDDNTVKVLQNGVSTTSRFSFKMLAFNDNYSKVFLHCAIHLCLLQGNNCAANCSPGHQDRAGRSVDIHDRSSISVGPFILEHR
uniref:ZP domain-containing protein n=1 Tax=Pygocentrus nattereri TaxID=42514 RepID=A0A3B4DKV2_PYGNA